MLSPPPFREPSLAELSLLASSLLFFQAGGEGWPGQEGPKQAGDPPGRDPQECRSGSWGRGSLCDSGILTPVLKSPEGSRRLARGVQQPDRASFVMQMAGCGCQPQPWILVQGPALLF